MQPSPSSPRYLMKTRLLPLAVTSVVTWAVGCVGDDKPEPVKVEQASPYERDVRPTKVDDPNDPLRNPAYETPNGPDGAQLPEAELEAVLAEAEKHAAIGDKPQQRIALGKCANKTPASARCDGEMGLSIIDSKNRRAAAIYHLVAAASVDDPKADASLYARVGQALSRHGKQLESLAAFERAIARDPSAENLFLLGQTLSLMPDRLIEAADRMAEARAKDDRIAWLYDEAVIRGQIPVREQAEAAVALFRLYKERTATMPSGEIPTTPEQLTVRIGELEALAKQYPTQAEWEKRRAAGPTAPPGLIGPNGPAKPAEPTAPTGPT